MISLDYKNTAPLHEQIHDKLKALIVRGVLKQGDKIPSVREMAISLTVNPNTVMHAFRSLESEGYIYSVKGRGSFIAEFSPADERLKLLYHQVKEAVDELAFIGENKDAVIELVEKIYSEREENHD